MESETTPQSEGAPGGSSLAAKLVNVFAAPGEVFDEIKVRPPAVQNWLVPAVVCIVATIIYSFAIFSQPNIQQQVREAQDRAIQQKVAAGKMTQAQADQAEAMMDKIMTPTLMALFGVIGGTIGTFVRLFWWGLVLWLVGRWLLNAQFSYLKALEVAGLATMITVLGAIVGMLLVMIMGRLSAGPHLAVMISNFEMTNKLHATLAAANLFSIWYVALVSAGVAKLAGKPFIRAALVIFTLWVVWEGLFIVTGLGQLAL